MAYAQHMPDEIKTEASAYAQHQSADTPRVFVARAFLTPRHLEVDPPPPDPCGSPSSPSVTPLKRQPWVSPEEVPRVNLMVSRCHNLLVHGCRVDGIRGKADRKT